MLPGGTATEIARARIAWSETLASHGIAAAPGTTYRDRLEARYREPHRAYHNLAHVAALVGLSDQYRGPIVDPAAVTLAIWYHDAIYLPRRSDNETASAELARRELGQLGFKDSIVETVAALILATRTHSGDGADDTPLFLDLDLAILGGEAPVYDAYAAAIRREYWWVPLRRYRTERARILRGFLDRDSIYLTDWFRARFEVTARVNLARELGA